MELCNSTSWVFWERQRIFCLDMRSINLSICVNIKRERSIDLYPNLQEAVLGVVCFEAVGREGIRLVVVVVVVVVVSAWRFG